MISIETRNQLEVSAIPSVFPYTVLNAPESQRGFAGGKLEQFDAPAEPVG